MITASYCVIHQRYQTANILCFVFKVSPLAAYRGFYIVYTRLGHKNLCVRPFHFIFR